VKRLPVTAVVVTRNAEHWVEPCLRSVRDNRPAEIMLVDGHSTDRTVELAAPHVDRVIYDGGAGVAVARQLGARESHQPWIAFIDADVTLPPDSLRNLVEEARRRRLSALQAGLHSVGSGDYWSEQLAEHDNRGRSRHWFGVSASLVLREEILRHPLDPRFVSGEDIDLRLRLERAGVAIGVADTTTVEHAYREGFALAREQWLADGAGIGRLVRKHGVSALPYVAVPFATAAWRIAQGIPERLRPAPYFLGLAAGNWLGLLRGLLDRTVPTGGRRRDLLVAATVLALLAFPVVPLAIFWRKCVARVSGRETRNASGRGSTATRRPR
jgi:hypothetical protein